MKKGILLTGILAVIGLFSTAFVYGASGGSNGGLDSYTTNMFNAGNNSTNIGISTIGTTSDQGGNLIQIIKNFINWILGILSLIALVLCLWGGFQIVTAAGDEGKQKKGMSVLKHAAIGLVIIGLAWFIVTIIFRLLRGVTGATSNGAANVTAQN